MKKWLLRSLSLWLVSAAISATIFYVVLPKWIKKSLISHSAKRGITFNVDKVRLKPWPLSVELLAVNAYQDNPAMTLTARRVQGQFKIVDLSTLLKRLNLSLQFIVDSPLVVLHAGGLDNQKAPTEQAQTVPVAPTDLGLDLSFEFAIKKATVKFENPLSPVSEIKDWDLNLLLRQWPGPIEILSQQKIVPRVLAPSVIRTEINSVITWQGTRLETSKTQIQFGPLAFSLEGLSDYHQILHDWQLSLLEEDLNALRWRPSWMKGNWRGTAQIQGRWKESAGTLRQLSGQVLFSRLSGRVDIATSEVSIKGPVLFDLRSLYGVKDTAGQRVVEKKLIVPRVSLRLGLSQAKIDGPSVQKAADLPSWISGQASILGKTLTVKSVQAQLGRLNAQANGTLNFNTPRPKIDMTLLAPRRPASAWREHIPGLFSQPQVKPWGINHQLKGPLGPEFKKLKRQFGWP